MTVAELIAALQQLPPDLPVCVNGGRNEIANGRDAVVVEEAQQQLDTGYTRSRWEYTCDLFSEEEKQQEWYRALYGDYEFRRCVNITS